MAGRLGDDIATGAGWNTGGLCVVGDGGGLGGHDMCQAL